MRKDEILAANETKTWKIQELLKLGLSRKEVAIEVDTNYGFVQNVFAKLYPERIKQTKIKPTIELFAGKLLELEMIVWSQNLDGLMKRASKQNEKIFGTDLSTDTFENFLNDLFFKPRPAPVEIIEEEEIEEEEIEEIDDEEIEETDDEETDDEEIEETDDEETDDEEIEETDDEEINEEEIEETDDEEIEETDEEETEEEEIDDEEIE